MSMRTPSILLAGATGNTGRQAVRTLSKLLEGKGIRIIALSRSLDSDVVKELQAYPGVEFEQFDWTDIDEDWLRERSVVKAFIAPQNGGSQFADESAFHLALLRAGVAHVVRTATVITAMNPASPIWYGRNHWAIETLLRSPEYRDLAFTSLCPNAFTSSYLSDAVGWVKDYRRTGKQAPLKFVLDRTAPVAMIDPNDVGHIAAHLLALDDFSDHIDKSYVLAGPEDVTGQDIVRLIQDATGVEVETVHWRNVQMFEDWARDGVIPSKFAKALIGGMTDLWDGSSGLAECGTSEPILKLARPTSTVADAFREMVDKI